MLPSIKIHIIDLLIKTAPDDHNSSYALDSLSCNIPASMLKVGCIVWNKTANAPMVVNDISRFANTNHDGHDLILHLSRRDADPIMYFCARKELVTLYRI
ncbi:hypothetical protein QJS83_14940 [Bdellovibrio sp. 22V]|uniref:hypothetical protein n=1 Tax=Bdellovibrio sp. 22V TaxID=3044166 RepID=UPI0025430229|nr:hypothetical protein [Bdellovibrio sp. 22V]WII71759.1 hypothetical protein QJS83_14940 [Bdellovibrio sp. 22V]